MRVTALCHQRLTFDVELVCDVCLPVDGDIKNKNKRRGVDGDTPAKFNNCDSIHFRTKEGYIKQGRAEGRGGGTCHATSCCKKPSFGCTTRLLSRIEATASSALMPSTTIRYAATICTANPVTCSFQLHELPSSCIFTLLSCPPLPSNCPHL
jgi:hypothetical protein